MSSCGGDRATSARVAMAVAEWCMCTRLAGMSTGADGAAECCWAGAGAGVGAGSAVWTELGCMYPIMLLGARAGAGLATGAA